MRTRAHGHWYNGFSHITGAGKHINPQLAFARKNGIEIFFGDPVEEVPGKNIILPAHPSLIKARDMDLNHMRASLIHNAVKAVPTAPTSAQQGRVRLGQAKRTAKLSVPAPARKNCATSWPICVLVKVIIPPSPPSAEK